MAPRTLRRGLTLTLHPEASLGAAVSAAHSSNIGTRRPSWGGAWGTRARRGLITISVMPVAAPDLPQAPDPTFAGWRSSIRPSCTRRPPRPTSPLSNLCLPVRRAAQDPWSSYVGSVFYQTHLLLESRTSWERSPHCAGISHQSNSRHSIYTVIPSDRTTAPSTVQYAHHYIPTYRQSAERSNNIEKKKKKKKKKDVLVPVGPF